VSVPDEKRRAERFPTLLRAELKIETEDRSESFAVVANMSRTGILVATPCRARLGQSVYFTFQDGENEYLAVGTIIANREGLGFVVEFQGETAEMKSFFDRIEKLEPTDQWSVLQSVEKGTIEIV
jgi:hypothetical protein